MFQLGAALYREVDGESRADLTCRYDASAKGSSLESALSEFFDADLAQWLLTEMAQNRDKAVGAKKVRGGVPCSYTAVPSTRCMHVQYSPACTVLRCAHTYIDRMRMHIKCS